MTEDPGLAASSVGRSPVATRFAFAIVTIVIVAAAWFLRSELLPTPDLNDLVLHKVIVATLLDAWSAGHATLDPWVAPISFGYPVLHAYQPLPYIATAVVGLITHIHSSTLVAWTTYLGLIFFPLIVFISARWMGLTRMQAAMSAMLSLLLTGGGSYGIELESYVWRGSGLYSQLWAQAALFLAVGLFVRSLRTGRHLTLSGALLAATLLCHSIFGFIAGITCALAAIILTDTAPSPRRLARALVMSVIAALGTLFFLLPMVLDRAGINRSRWELQWKWDSLGASEVMHRLIHGDLLDSGRLPVITILLAIGILIAIFRRRSIDLFLLSGLVLWLVAFFGRPTLGILFDLVPLGHDLPIHRLVSGAHFFAILLAGSGIGFIADAILTKGTWWRSTAAAALILIAVVPPAIERCRYLNAQNEWRAADRAAFATEAPALDSLFDVIRSEPRGRVYAGLPTGWGRDFKVGYVPMYAILAKERIDAVSYLFHAMSPASDAMPLFDERREDHYRAFHVGWVIAEAGRPMPSFLSPAKRVGRFVLYRAPGVDAVGIAPCGAEVPFTQETEWQFSSARLAGDAGFDAPLPLLTSGSDAIRCTPASDWSGRVIASASAGGGGSADVVTGRDSVVVLDSSWHPRWRVTVDGNPAPQFSTPPGFVATSVGPGQHHIEFQYVAQPWKTPLAALTLLAFIGGIIAEKRPPQIAAFLAAQLENALQWLGDVGRRTIPMGVPQARRFAFLIAIVILAGLPLLQPYLLTGHDVFAYPPRLVEFHESLRSGIIPPRWAPDLGDGRGEPLWIFAPPLYELISEPFYALGAPLFLADNLALLTLLFIAALSAYLLGRRWGSPASGLLAATAFVFAPYVLLDLYVRHAAAELTGVAFLPLVILGIDRAAGGEKRFSTGVTAAACAAVLLAHGTVALALLPLLLIVSVAFAIGTRRWRPIASALMAVVIALATTCWFWLPAVVESIDSNRDLLVGGYENFHNHFVYFRQFVSFFWGYGMSVAGPDDGMSFTLGPLLLLIATIGAVRGSRGSAIDRTRTIAALAVGALGVFLATAPSTPLWEAVPSLRYVVFPWRFLMLPALAIAALCVYALRDLPRLALVASVAIVALSLPIAHPSGYHTEQSALSYAPDSIAANAITVTTKDEFRPRWARVALPFSDAPFDGIAATTIQKSPEYRRYRVATTTTGSVRLNLRYFPGWAITVDGKPVASHPAADTGLVEFVLPSGEHEVVARFGSTPIRRLAGGISAATIALVSGWWIVLLLQTIARRSRSRVNAPAPVT